MAFGVRDCFYWLEADLYNGFGVPPPTSYIAYEIKLIAIGEFFTICGARYLISGE